jgi:hypothetical protein
MRTWLICRHKEGFGEKRILFEYVENDSGFLITRDVQKELDTEKRGEEKNGTQDPTTHPETPHAQETGAESVERSEDGFSGFDLSDEELTEDTFDQRQKSASDQVLEMYHRSRPSKELEQRALVFHSQKEFVTRKIDELNKNYRSFGDNLWRKTIDRIRVTNERAIQQLRVLSEREIRAGEILQELKERKARVSEKSKKLHALAKQIGISRPLLKVAAGFAGAREGINATLRRRSAEEKANGVFYGRLVNRAEKDVTAIRSEASAEAKRLHAMLEKRFRDDTKKREGIIDYLLPENTPSEQKEAKKRELQEMITAYVTKPDMYAEDQDAEYEKQKKREEMQKMIDGIQDVGDRRIVQILLKSMQPRLAGIRKTPTSAKYHETIRDIHKTAQDMEKDKAAYKARKKLDAFFAKHPKLKKNNALLLDFGGEQKNLSREWRVEHRISDNEYRLSNNQSTNTKIIIRKDPDKGWEILQVRQGDNIACTYALQSISFLD